MARVNHKRVKQLLNEKRSRITDRQFFTSRILAGHFEDMAMAQTRRYKYNRRIHVAISWSPKSGEVACTNNLSVLINAFLTLERQKKYKPVTISQEILNSLFDVRSLLSKYFFDIYGK